MSLEYYLSDPTNPSVCDVFKAAAKETWARICFSRKTPNLKSYETTVTQNLVYELFLLKQKFPSLGFNLFESTNEKTNGDDLELSVMHADGLYTYAIQSKIIYHRKGSKLKEGYYEKLKHSVGKGSNSREQIDLLLTYASTHKYIPLYLLYNYVQQDSPRSVDDALYGCTVIGAKYLKDRYTVPNGALSSNVKFSDLHPSAAFPWHELVCDLPSLSEDEFCKKLMLEQDSYLVSDKSFGLKGADQWKKLDISDHAVVLSDEMSGRHLQSDEDIPKVFSPKFKIVVNAIKTE